MHGRRRNLNREKGQFFNLGEREEGKSGCWEEKTAIVSIGDSLF